MKPLSTFTAAVLVIAPLVLAGCGTTPADTPSDPEPFEITYRVEGGIAGMLFVDLVIRDDGSVLRTNDTGEPVQLTVPRAEAARLLANLEALDVYELDDPDPLEGLADGTTTTITVRSGTGDVAVSAYGLGEDPSQFDADLVQAARLLADFAAELEEAAS